MGPMDQQEPGVATLNGPNNVSEAYTENPARRKGDRTPSRDTIESVRNYSRALCQARLMSEMT